MTSRSSQPEVLVVGGGIVGLASAVAMAQHGIAVDVLEQATEFSEIGAGIQLAPNALRVLDRLGVLADISGNAVYPQRATMLNALSGELITAIDFGAGFRKRYGYPYVVIHRSDLLDGLLRSCMANPLITLRNAKAVEEIDDGARTATVRCADGSAYTAKAVVGADGIWSRVRRHTVGADDVTFQHHVAFRGAVPVADVSEHAGIDNVTWWVGPNMHLIQYPIRRAELFNQVAVVGVDDHRPDDESWATAEDLDRHIADKTDYVRAGARLLQRDRRWLLYDRDPVQNWTRGNVTLVGDAAHPMLPYMAQGACQALEDAVCLADQLNAHGGDVPAALDAYQRVRIPHTAKVVEWARRMGDIVHLGGVGAMLRDELLGQRADDDYEYFDWIYGGEECRT